MFAGITAFFQHSFGFGDFGAPALISPTLQEVCMLNALNPKVQGTSKEAKPCNASSQKKPLMMIQFWQGR